MDVGERARALDVARRVAIEAGEVLKGFFLGDLQVRHKGDVDLVSQADLASEACIREGLLGAFPDDAMLGEEGGWTPGGRRTWVVDPLDGTTNFIHGLPHFNVSIALEIGGVVQVGVVHDPIRGETFTTQLGGGAFLGARRLQVSRAATLEDALLATGFPVDRRERPHFYLDLVAALLMRGQGIRRAGAAALDLAWVAAGRLDGYWELNLKPWDVAAGSLLVTEAGGRVSAAGGTPFALDAPLIIASNGALHDALAEVLDGVHGPDALRVRPAATKGSG